MLESRLTTHISVVSFCTSTFCKLPFPVKQMFVAGNMTLLTFFSYATNNGNANLKQFVPVCCCICMAATASIHIYHCETVERIIFCTHATHTGSHMLAHCLKVEESFIFFNSKPTLQPKQKKPPKHPSICATRGGSPQLAEASDTLGKHFIVNSSHSGAMMYCRASHRKLSAHGCHANTQVITTDQRKWRGGEAEGRAGDECWGQNVKQSTHTERERTLARPGFR